MRLILISSALIAGILGAQTPAQQSGEKGKEKARVEGSVLSSTGAPVPRATLRLQPANAVAQASGALSTTATAGADGAFVIENIEPGTYTLTAQRPGFVNTIYGSRRPGTPGTPLVLEAGAVKKGIDVSMVPQGVISGRVTDMNGDLLQGIQVMALRQGYQRGSRSLVQAGAGSSNDLGEYRIANLQPGQYVIAAVDRRAVTVLAQAGGASTEGREANVTTYYPNATDPKAAAPITIAAGADQRGTDIRMRTAKVFSISGKAVGPGGAAVGNTILAMISSDSLTGGDPLLSALSRTTMQVRPDGAFSASNLASGRYTLMTLTNVVLNGQPAPNYTGRAEITIVDEDIKDVVFALGPGATISGSVSLDGGVPIEKLLEAAGPANPNASSATAISAAALGVTVAGVSPAVGLVETAALLGNPPNGKVNPDGTFTINTIGPSRYGVVVGGLPKGYYVKSARMGGADVMKNGLDFSNGGGGGELSIVLSNKAATVSVVARNSRGEAESGRIVALWSEEPEFGSRTNGVRTGYTDQSGSFSFPPLAPGKYFVAAFEDADAQQLQNRELLQLLVGDAEELDLEESATAAKELKAISVEALAQYMAKVP